MRPHHALTTLAPMLLLLPSCVGAPATRPVAAAAAAAVRKPTVPAPVPVSAPVEWQYRTATPGNWTYRVDGNGSVAIFASAASRPLLTLRCDPAAARVSLARVGASAGALTVRTSYGATSWPTSADALGQPVAARAASDAFLDQIAYSRGHFAVEAQGLEPLILPAWAEVGRVIEDCRR